jgi:hypothetical protein
MDPKNKPYFGEKGFKVVDRNSLSDEILNTDVSLLDQKPIDPIGSGTCYFFEASTFSLGQKSSNFLNKKKTNLSSSSSVTLKESKYLNFHKINSQKDAIPSFSRFYNELKNLKKTDPKMKSNLSFTYFC